MNVERPTRLVAGCTALLAVGVRLPHALNDSFWQDEVASARILREPTFSGMLHHVARTESTPPLWYALAWLAHRGGVSIHDTRLLSVAFGGLLAGLVVVLARRVLPLAGAAVAGVLAAVSAQLAWHGHELRAYELFALLTVVFAFAIDAAARRPTRLRLTALAGATAAGAMTHYFFAFSIAAALLWVWLEPAVRPSRRRMTVAIAAGLAVCIPWTPLFLRQYRHNGFWWIGPFQLHELVHTPLRLFTPFGSSTVAAVVLILALAAGGAALWRTGALGRLCGLLATVPLLLAGTTWLAGMHVYAVRNLIGIAPFAGIALAAAVAALPSPVRTAAAAVVACLAVGAFAWNQRVPAPPYEQLAHALVAEGWQPVDRVVVFGSFYAYRSPLEWYLPHRHATSRRSSIFAIGAAGLRHLGDDRVVATMRVGSYTVVRLRLDEPVRRDRLLRRGTALIV